jgi:hypothetical protein
MAAREAALNGQWSKPEIGASRTVAGTVNAAIVSYYKCTAFNDALAESSRKMRRNILERFREEHGEKRMFWSIVFPSAAARNLLTYSKHSFPKASYVSRMP